MESLERESRSERRTGTALMLRLVTGPEDIDDSGSEAVLEVESEAVVDSQVVAARIWAWEQEQFPIRGPRLRLPKRGYRPRLTIDKILTWADAHHRETGLWPTVRSGLVNDSPYDETWNAIQSALSKGLRGLPGDSSLARLLAEHRNVRPPLSVERILNWADEHYAAQRRWPTQTSGPVASAYRENWGSISRPEARSAWVARWHDSRSVAR
jgi:hypothetical protein